MHEGNTGQPVVDIRPLIARWDMFYEASYGNLEGVYKAFSERCTHEGYVLPMQSFMYRNKIAPIVQKRAEAIPTEFSFELRGELEGDEEAARWLESWLYGPWFGDGGNIWQALGLWNLMLERHGNLILKLASEVPEEGGPPKVYVSRMDPGCAEKFVDPEDVTKVTGWRFTWTNEVNEEGGGKKKVKIEEWYDAQVFRRKVNDELVREDEHNLGFIPVVHIRIGGSQPLWGMSVIEDLIEPQLMLALAQSTIRQANRWRGWPAFAGTAAVTEVDLRPGGYTPVDSADGGRGGLWAITWNSSAESLYKERDDYLEDLYERGRVTRKSRDVLEATGSLPSGKALIVLTQDFVQYLKGVVSILEEGMAELIAKALVMAGHLSSLETDEPPVKVTYAAVRIQDEDQKIAKAKLLIDAYARGVLPKKRLLEELLTMELIESDVDADTLMQELEEQEARGEMPTGLGLGGLIPR